MRRLPAFFVAASLSPLWAQCDSAAAAAEEALRNHDTDKAEAIVTRARADLPNCSRLLLSLARIQAERNQPEAALRSLRQYTEAEPGDPQGFEALAGFLATKERDYSAAEQAIRKALALDPKDVNVLMLEGDILGREGRERDAEAERAFEQTCALAPDSPAPYFRLGVFLDSRGRRADAVVNFRKVVARDAGNPTAWQYLALNLEQLGQPDQAEAAYQHGLAVNREPRVDPFLPYNYGKLLLNRNRLAESEKYLDEAAGLLPDNGAVFYQRARLFVRMHRYAEARADAERVLALPEARRYTLDVQLDYLLATIYERLGEKDLARKYADLARSARQPETSAVR